MQPHFSSPPFSPPFLQVDPLPQLPPVRADPLPHDPQAHEEAVHAAHRRVPATWFHHRVCRLQQGGRVHAEEESVRCLLLHHLHTAQHQVQGTLRHPQPGARLLLGVHHVDGPGLNGGQWNLTRVGELDHV